MEGRFVSWTSHPAACRRMYLFISAVFLLCYKVATVVDTSVWFVSEAHRALLTLSPPARKGPRPVTWPGGPTVWKRAPRGPHLPMKHRRGEGHMEPRAGQQAGHHGDTERSVGSSGEAGAGGHCRRRRGRGVRGTPPHSLHGRTPGGRRGRAAGKSFEK